MSEARKISRRGLLKGGVRAAASAGLAPLVTGAGSATGSRPNIVLLITDQQSATMLSCAGNEYLETPAMDSLARSGTRFERAYAADPVCVPSRFSMMTGLMPSACGYTDNSSGHRNAVPEEVVKNGLGWLIRDTGYETAYGGKVHLPKGMNAQNIGFDYFCRDQRDKLAKECADFIRRDHDKPFFLVGSFINPHDICYMAIREHQGKDYNIVKLAEGMKRPEGVSDKEFFAKHCPPLPDNFEVPEREPEAIDRLLRMREFRIHAREAWSEEMWRWHRWTYCRLTEMVDRQIGQVLRALRESGKEEDTVVIFVSDHGDHDAAHRMEHKTAPYDESARLPLIVSHKGVTPGGRVEDTHFVNTGLDLLPTICDYAGVEPSKHLQGRSARALAEGRRVSTWPDQVCAESQISRMLCTDRWKYCVYYAGKDREQLNDRQKDPGEMVNLAPDPDYRDVLNEHRRRMYRWMRRVDDRIGLEYVVRPEQA